jgi:membrane protein implicated in regulation of membrane protease activity
MLIYAAIGMFGLLFLLVMLFLGDIGGDHEISAHDLSVGHDDLGHGGPSMFSARIMASFLTAFGVGGVVARYYSLSYPASSIVGIVSGVVMSRAVYQFAKILYAQQASSLLPMAKLVGQSAEVSVAIPPDGVGQVTVTFGGERSDHIARSADGQAVPRGAEVTITGLRGDSVVVTPAVPGTPGPAAASRTPGETPGDAPAAQPPPGQTAHKTPGDER